MVCVRKSVFLAEPHDGVEKLSSLACFLFLFLSVDFFLAPAAVQKKTENRDANLIQLAVAIIY